MVRKKVSSKPSHDALVILITAASPEEARKIAHTLVSERLVACVNLVSSVESIYTWDDKVCDEREVLLVCKSRRTLFGKVASRVKELHSYQVPEIIGIPVVEGSSDYLQWIRQVTRSR